MQGFSAGRLWLRKLVALTAIGTLLLTGCTGAPKPEPTGVEQPPNSASPPSSEPDAKPAIEALTKALASGNIKSVPTLGANAEAVADYTAIMAGMDGLRPKVAIKSINYAGSGVAKATLTQTYAFTPKPFTFESEVGLNLVQNDWRVVWKPSVVHPDLTEISRMRHNYKAADRAPIIGAKGLALVEERTVYQVGIDKQNLAPGKWATSAKALAKALKIDEAAFAAKVARMGAKAFVIALVLRQSEIPPSITSIPGVISVPITRMLGPTKDFAVGVMGAVGEATDEQVKASNGALIPGQMVGLTGLQKRYDVQLRGTPGRIIEMVLRKGAKDDPTNPFTETTLFAQDPVAGKPVELTLDLDLQMKAEEVLSKVKPVASIVAIRPSTGEVLVAANSPASNANPDATLGHYAPGSTFKVATALALVRKGMSAGSPIQCPATINVNGYVFKNYTDYPAGGLGLISLQDALSNSCNTAFIGSAPKLGANDLLNAASSLGMGTDYDVGFSSFYGSVPETSNPVVKGANTIGQGLVEASPMSMAAVAASVSAGKTVVPWMVKGYKPTSKAAPLTANEAAQLQQMMKTVVSSGPGRGLQGVMVGAKTGTAQYGNANPPKTHAWMIAYRGDLAVAVMVADGVSGSQTALPLLKAFAG